MVRRASGVTLATTVMASIGLPVTAAAGLAGCQDPATVAETLSCQSIPVDQSWRSHVLDAPGQFVWPQSVSIEGNAAEVINPGGLVGEGNGATTLTTTKDGSTRLIVDLGRLVSGYLELGVKQASGAPIRMSYAEGREYLGRWGDGDTTPGSFFYHGATLGTDDDPDGRADVFAPQSGTTTLRSPGLRGSQRYVAITLDGPGTVTLDFLRVRQTNLAGKYDGHFLSNDDTLNSAWYASAYAMDLSTVRDIRKNPDGRWVIIDGPKRDRLVYAGDLRVDGQAAYYQGADYQQIMRDTINLFACQQAPDGTLPAASLIDVPCKLGDPGPPNGSPPGFEPPAEVANARIDSFTAWWVVDLADYLRYTGDSEFVRPLLPVARRAMQFFAQHAPDGILWRTDLYGKAFAGNWHTPDKATGVDAYSNEAYYGALRSLAQIERTVAHDPAAAAALDLRATRVHEDLLARLWDPQVGAMVLNTEDPTHDHTADANIGALLFGVLDDQQAHSAMSYLQSRLGTPYGTLTTALPQNPYMTQYISPYLLAEEALGRFRYGDGVGALRLLRSGWANMLVRGPGTPWEQVGADGSPGGAGGIGGNATGLAHAWSTVVPALSMEVLGVSPISDGYRTWAVRPTPADLRWAQGDVPTPDGTMSVRWQRGPGDSSFVLTIESRENNIGSVGIPLLGKGRTIAMDGRTVWQDNAPAAGVNAHRDGDTVVFDGARGDHTFAWTP